MAWNSSPPWQEQQNPWAEPTSQHDLTESGWNAQGSEQDSQEGNARPLEGSWNTWTAASANDVAPQNPKNNLQAATDQLQQGLQQVRAQDLHQNTIAAMRVLHNTLGTWLPATVQDASAQEHTQSTSACHCAPIQSGVYQCHPEDTCTYHLAQLTKIGRITPIDDAGVWSYCRCSQKITATGMPCNSLVIIRHGWHCLSTLQWVRTGPNKGWVCPKARH